MKLRPPVKNKRLASKASAEFGEELTPALLQRKILSGEAQYLGTMKQNGEIHDYYQVALGNKTTYVYNVREGQ